MNELGERLQLLRKARGWSLEELATRIGAVVTRQALYKYEKGGTQPSRKVLVALADAFGVPPSSFFTPPSAHVHLEAYRKKSGLRVCDREQIESSVILAIEDRVRLQNLLGIKTKPLPVQQFEVAQLEDAEDAAQKLRALWGLGEDPISNVTRVLEENGFHVIEQDASPKFDGLSAVARDENGVAIAAAVISRSGLPGERQRLNFTHEVGHIVPKITNSDLNEEWVAFRFGGAFLAPANILRREVGEKRTAVGWDELLMLKGSLGISVQALLRRLYDLEIISKDHYTEWFRFLTVAGLRKTEPNELPAEKPEWLRRNVLRAWSEGILASTEAERLLGEPLQGAEISPVRLSQRQWSAFAPEERLRLLAQGAERAAQFYCVNPGWLRWATEQLGDAPDAPKSEDYEPDDEARTI
ncbi:MAG TPA: XRE family transcriptional regulator [Abditibacterium sp.]|jgi:transcriptional regulator with XRE-family HTH domain